MDILDKLMLEKLNYNKPKIRVTKSYHKGRAYRVQNIFDKNGFTVKQIIHHM